MAPSVVTLDPSSDFDFPAARPQKSTSASRTLLLAPPSISAHPEALNRVFESHDRSVTDIQMLDRLSHGLVSLPESTYDVVLVLTDADGTRSESQKLLGRNMMSRIVTALKAGGSLRSQDGSFGASSTGPEEMEGILAGLVPADGPDGGMMKPVATEAQSVPLRFGKKAKAAPADAANATNDTVPVNLNGKRKSVSEPSGVGFVDFSNDLDLEVGDDDDLVDEDDLLTEEDKSRAVIPRTYSCVRSDTRTNY
jgi:anamorsin